MVKWDFFKSHHENWKAKCKRRYIAWTRLQIKVMLFLRVEMMWAPVLPIS